MKNKSILNKSTGNKKTLNESELNKNILNKLELENITVYFEYSKNNKKLEECIENILINEANSFSTFKENLE